MFKKFLYGLSGLCVAFTVATQSAASDTIIDEARFGGSWIDIPIGNVPNYYEFNQPGVNGEILFTPINIDFLDLLDTSQPGIQYQMAMPRVHLGATVAFDSDTASSLYTGLTWHFPVVSGLFVEGSFGAALHDGEMSTVRPAPGRAIRGLGSALLFREGVAVGFEVTEQLNVLVQLSHISHAGLAGDDNAGQTDLAVKAGWKF